MIEFAEPQAEETPKPVSIEAFESVCKERGNGETYYRALWKESLRAYHKTLAELEELKDKHKSLQARYDSNNRSYLLLYNITREYLDAAEYEGEIDESRELRQYLWNESDTEKQIESEDV